ncbi:protein kinase domain-containing protein [Planctomycetaceae bacterium SH139]
MNDDHEPEETLPPGRHQQVPDKLQTRTEEESVEFNFDQETAAGFTAALNTDTPGRNDLEATAADLSAAAPNQNSEKLQTIGHAPGSNSGKSSVVRSGSGKTGAGTAKTGRGAPDETVNSLDKENNEQTSRDDFSLGETARPAGKAAKTMIGMMVGDYRIDGELGRGGMGVVYRGHHRTLQRDVAIKMILGSSGLDPVAVQRFEVEARAVASLQHPNIVQLFELANFAGSPYVALEYVDGGTLSARMKESPLAAKEAARIVETLARTMQAAHDRGILHRDLKPANILMTSDGVPKISDFGLAKNLAGDDQNETKTGTVMGTPSFMSPEQAQGMISELSGATDQYSLGAILYASLCGRPPFLAASTIDTVTQVVNKEPVPPRRLTESIPLDLETICLKVLQKDPSKRYPSCKELADDLQRFIEGEPIHARPISKLEKSWRWCRRNPAIALPSGLAGMLIVATAAISSWAWVTTAAQSTIITQERDTAQQERDEARRQRLIAIQQRAAAEENRALAEKQAEMALRNTQFVVRDIDAQLRKLPGMSDVRIEILEAVSRKWDELNVELVGGVRGEAIPTLMAARQALAITFEELDQLEQAQREFIRLEEMARERINIKGRTDSVRTNLVKVLLASATLSRRLEHDPLEGIKKLEQAVALIEEVIAEPAPEPDSPSINEILQLKSATSMNLGVEYLRDGRVAATNKMFSQALDANLAVLENIRSQPGFDEQNDDQKDTQTAALKIQLDKSRLGVAYIRLRLGKTEEALQLYQAAIASRREIFQRRPQMLVMKTELAGFLKLYGKSLIWIDQVDEGGKQLREAVSLSEEAYLSDPEKADLKRSFAEALFLLGTTRDLQARKDEALSLFERSRLLRADLYEASPDEKNQINLMLSEARVGNVEAALEHIKSLGETTEPNSELHLERARALAQLSLVVADEQREQMRSDSLAALQRSIDEGFGDPFRVAAEADLEPIRNTDRYAGILRSMQTTNAAAK